jgi:hypothetical protein
MFKYHLAALRRALRKAEHGLALLDRNWLSEEVYAHFYRNGTKWPHQGRIIDKLLLKHAAITVLCLLSKEEAIEQVEKHRKDGKYHAPEFLTRPPEIAQRYWDIYHGKTSLIKRATYADDLMELGGAVQRADHIKYRISEEGTNIDQFIDELICSLENHREEQYQPALQFGVRNIAGHLDTARWLIVGDTVNYHDYRKCWPFLSYAGSTLFMASVFHKLNIAEEQLMWTNADCPEQHITALITLKPSLKLVALGRKAENTIKALGLPCTRVAHPSFGRRFMDSNSWAKSLGAALAV